MRVYLLLGAWAVTACRPDDIVDRDPSLPDFGVRGDTADQTTPDRPPGPLTTSGPITCEDPEARRRLGPLYTPDLGPAWAAQVPAGTARDATSPAGGVAVADFTGDGRLDYFLPADSPCMLFTGQPDGTLADESAARIPRSTEACRAWGASAGDYDGDGDLDLYLVRDRAPDLLWNNDGTGHFTDVTTAAGIPATYCGGRSASWGDMDGDGDLDLFVARHRTLLEPIDGTCDLPEAPGDWRLDSGHPNTLLMNRGDGSFVDVTARLPFHGVYAYTFIGGWLDLDRDHDLDLVLVNDFSPHSTDTTAFLNDGDGLFTELAPAAGLQLTIFAMSLSAADLNADGHPDLAISDIDNLHLMESIGRREWVNHGRVRTLVPDRSRDQAAAWGIAMEDVDNDGLVDVTTVFGPTEEPLAAGEEDVLYQPDALFRQQPDGTFTDEGPAWGFDDTGVGRGLVVADLNGDGWLDFVRPDYRSGPTDVTYQRCGHAAWATVSLDGPGDGYGARVEVEAGGRLQVRWLDSSSEALGSTGPAQVHFGLGETEQIEVLRVFWPDGVVTENHDIMGRQHLVVGRP